MKIEQKKTFEPITLTIETRAEAQELWDMATAYENQRSDYSEVVIKIINWFSHEAKLSANKRGK